LRNYSLTPMSFSLMGNIKCHTPVRLCLSVCPSIPCLRSSWSKKVTEASNGVVRRTSTRYAAVNRRLTELWSQYAASTLSTSRFLRAAGHLQLHDEEWMTFLDMHYPAWSCRFQGKPLRLHSHSYEYESRYPYTASSKHKIAYMPVVAVHIDTSSARVRITCEFHSCE